MPEISVADIRYLKPDEFQVILDAIEDNSKRWRRRQDEFKPWFPLALRAYRATGARPAEIVGKSSRIRRTEEEGYAEQSGIQEHHGLRVMDLKGDCAALLEGKNTMGGRRRARGLKPRLVTVADRAVYKELEELGARAPGPEAHLFGLGPSPRQHGDGYWQLTRQVQKLRPFLPPAIQDFQVRWLRHSWAIYALRNGIDIYEVSRQLGHADISITAIYLRFAPVSRDKVVGIFTPGKPAEPAKHDCPACGFTWRVDEKGIMLRDDRLGAVLRQPRRSRHSG